MIVGYWLPVAPLLTFLEIVLIPIALTMFILTLLCLRHNLHIPAMLTIIKEENNAANIGAVASIARYDRHRSLQLQVATIIEQSVGALTVPLLLDMCISDRLGLYEFMIYASPITCVGILSVCEQAQDPLALPFVRRLIRRYRSKNVPEVLAQAIHCLAYLEAHSLQTQSQTLLRASTPCTKEELLRSASHKEPASEELLRTTLYTDIEPLNHKQD